MTTPSNSTAVTETEIVPGGAGRKPRKASTAIARREESALAVASPRITIEDMIMKALEMDKPELIDKFTAIYEKQEAERKKTAFTAAMSRAQANMVPVANNATNTFTSSRYAKLAAINRMAVPIYGAEGLAVSFKTGVADKPGERRTIAIVSHEAGYMTTPDDFYVDLPLDDSGSGGRTNKTQLHATKSTSTYAKNMLVCMIFNISTEDDVDDDGNGGATVSPKDARKQRQPVSQPKATPTAQRATTERARLEPAGEGEAVDVSTIKGLTAAMTKAALGNADFVKRFPALSGLEQLKKTDSRVVMSWIADPIKN